MSEREMQALGSIENGLADSDPALASMMGIFSRLTSGEEMPAREKIQVRRRAVHSPRRARRRPRHSTALRWPRQLYLRLGWQQAMLLAWVVVSAGLITVALALNAGGHTDRTPLTGMARSGQACSSRVQAARPPVRNTVDDASNS